VGGVTHNIGQLIVAIIVVKNLNIALYTPILMIAGVITGCIIGLLSYKILQILKKVEHD
jgi:heptaprenyl diphosphate synthase